MLRLAAILATAIIVLALDITPASAQTVFINEIHYDNSGSDVGEAIEIAGPAGTDLTGWQLVRYNGNGGAAYGTDTLSGSIVDDGTGFGFVVQSYAPNGLQNGAPDGVALVDAGGNVVQFLSYEGSFTAVGGAADGLTSTDIGVSETSSTPVAFSLQLAGTGSSYADFAWSSDMDSFGAVNVGQSFGGTPPPPPAGEPIFINEIHYDNAGSDVDESIEIAGPAGTDLTGWQLVRYNGNGGAVYGTDTFATSIPDDGTGFGFVVQSYPANGLQNGAPDGVALVDASGAVVQFLSYEGSFAAVGGPADGMMSTDIGVSETSSTAAGSSLQLTGTGQTSTEFTWSSAQAATFGAVNTGQSFTGAPPPPPPPPPTVSICEIQGAGASSPYANPDQDVTTTGIVTGDFQDVLGSDGDLNGFYIEDPTCDDDPATSNGIFVFQGFNPDVDVLAGQTVSVVGTVAEFFGETQLNATTAVGAVTITDAAISNVAPTAVALPSAAIIDNSDGEAIADLEQYEGMLVDFTGYYEVTELFNLDRFGEMVLAAGGRFTQYTQANAPDAAGYAAHLDDLGSRTLYVDDGLTVQNPDPIRFPAPGLDSLNTVRMGDVVTNLVGNLRFSRGSGGSGDEAYRLQPTLEPMIVPANPRMEAPVRMRKGVRVASINVLNFYTTIDESGAACFPRNTRSDCRGADSVEEYDRQLEKLVTMMSEIDADVFGLVEIENNYIDGSASAIQTLATALNAVAAGGCTDYQGVIPESGRIGDDTIAVGMLYCASRVRIAPDTQVAILDDTTLTELADKHGADFPSIDGPVFDGFATSRAPLAVTFRPKGSKEQLTVVVNHFKSKGSAGLASSDSVCATDPAADPNCDQGDGAGYWDERRTDASRAVLAWLRTNPTGAKRKNIAILGDLNAYLNEDPILEFENSGVVNLMRDIPDAYSFVFGRQAGTLDYVLTNRRLAKRLLQISEWHINADEPDALDYNLDFGRNPALFDGGIPERASDHDPIVVDFDLSDRK